MQRQKIARGLKFRLWEVEGLYCLCSENKGADQLRGYREADLRLCFRICKKPGSPRRGSNGLLQTLVPCQKRMAGHLLVAIVRFLDITDRSKAVVLSCFCVRVLVMFHFIFVHYTFSSVSVAKWPPFGKYLPARLAICSPCILSICNIYLIPALVLRAGFAF